MAPPSGRSGSPSKRISPSKRHASPSRHYTSSSPSKKRAASGSPSKKRAAKRQPSAPTSKRASYPSAGVLSVSKLVTPSSKAAVDKASKLASAVQVNISFETVDKFKAGLKILLDDSIYGNDEVSSFC